MQAHNQVRMCVHVHALQIFPESGGTGITDCVVNQIEMLEGGVVPAKTSTCRHNDKKEQKDKELNLNRK